MGKRKLFERMGDVKSTLMDAVAVGDIRTQVARPAQGAEARWDIYIKCIGLDALASFNTHAAMETRSVIKVASLGDVLRRADEEELWLDDMATTSDGYCSFGSALLSQFSGNSGAVAAGLRYAGDHRERQIHGGPLFRSGRRAAAGRHACGGT
jgi:hypothetical protein